jgi:hypothetical protein
MLQQMILCKKKRLFIQKYLQHGAREAEATKQATNIV